MRRAHRAHQVIVGAANPVRMLERQRALSEILLDRLNAEEPHLDAVLRALLDSLPELGEPALRPLRPAASKLLREVSEGYGDPQAVDPLARKRVEIAVWIIVDVVHQFVAVVRRALDRAEEAARDTVCEPRSPTRHLAPEVEGTTRLTRKERREPSKVYRRLRRRSGDGIRHRAVDRLGTAGLRGNRREESERRHAENPARKTALAK